MLLFRLGCIVYVPSISGKLPILSRFDWQQLHCCTCIAAGVGLVAAAAGQDLDLQRLYRCTTDLGGAVAVTDQHRWPVSACFIADQQLDA